MARTRARGNGMNSFLPALLLRGTLLALTGSLAGQTTIPILPSTCGESLFAHWRRSLALTGGAHWRCSLALAAHWPYWRCSLANRGGCSLALAAHWPYSLAIAHWRIATLTGGHCPGVLFSRDCLADWLCSGPEFHRA